MHIIIIVIPNLQKQMCIKKVAKKRPSAENQTIKIFCN